jgi:phage shock protein A
MTEEELAREYKQLRAEHGELEAEHQQLRQRPKDIDAHRAMPSGSAHVKRLHEYTARLAESRH